MAKMIKLGNCWFSSDRIDCICASRPPLGLIVNASGQSLEPNENGNYVYVRLRGGSCVTIAYFGGIDESELYADTLASLVNGD